MRLTNHFDYCDFISCKYRNPELAKVNQCDFFNMTSRDKCHDKAIYEKLKEYEDLEEQGLLLKLPCKVGDVVYSVECDRIKEFIATQFDVFTENIYAISGSIFVGLMGYSVFATREEAEKALAEMGCE
jgi:hypothetical protein